MSRNERFDDIVNIAKLYPVADGRHGGPIVFYRNGIPYCDPGEMHIAAIGTSGGGKTQVVVLPYISNCAKAGESFIVIDPKKELYLKTSSLVEKTHKTLVFDFRTPTHTKDYWNPLQLPYYLIKSGDPEKMNRGYTAVHQMASSLMPHSEKDMFWEVAGADLLCGVIGALIELADDPEEVNMSSVLRMLRDGNEKIGGDTYLQSLYKHLPEDSFAKDQLSTYCHSPQDTRNSIFAVCRGALSVFSFNRTVLEMISKDTIDIAHLDNSDQPLAIYIVLPDESANSLGPLTSVFVKQLTQHFIKLAQSKPTQKLGNRLHVILEELGSTGVSIDNLPNLAVASRSRNVRLVLILQSEAQLDSLYGTKEAETIRSCIGLNYCFTTNHFGTLEAWSKKSGYKEVVKNGSIIKTELITPTQIASMPPLTCLVFLGRYKYIHHFPLFYESCFHIEERKEVDDEGNIYERKPVPIFSIKNWVEAVKAKEREELFRNEPLLDRMFGGSHSLPVMDTRDNLPKREAPKKDEEDVQKRLDELQRQLENLDKEDDE